MFSAREGQARTTSIAEKTLIAPAVRSVLLTAAIGIAMLGIGLAFAIRMAATIARAPGMIC